MGMQKEEMNRRVGPCSKYSKTIANPRNQNENWEQKLKQFIGDDDFPNM